MKKARKQHSSQAGKHVECLKYFNKSFMKIEYVCGVVDRDFELHIIGWALWH